ncbi:GNAT family N-acetyltransferase [Pseudofrankia inefficax]|uniref:GCN5-related N-acetyltransferase n=1 Tax=Pseudofrankia inefficax (strain DSM 45817 / CECT 9037 / DDB 130130 / EuI1c) TaxID=298654 RepID=E3J1N5_PSEI1|nr:GNAT family N-acetyltransferase [Pseudofrankia inefficax]ADP81703.1 GCN5-related N-acetyltransferase [Pseudofrankia inefficax]
MRIQEPNWAFSLGDGRVTHARALASDEDVTNLQRLFELLPSYCEKTIGFPPGPAEAHSTLIARPPSSTPDDKLPIGAFDADGRLVGYSDLILRFPEQSQCYIGYVLVDPECQHQGLGTYLLEFSVKLAASRQPQCTHAVTGLIETFGQPGQTFLDRGGFVPTGTATPYEVNTISSTRREYVKAL